MRIKAGRGPYFAQIPWALQDDPRTDSGMIATYASLRRYSDFGGPTGCRASHRTLSQKAHLSSSTFRLKLAALRALGWIEWQSGKVDGTPNVYIVHASLGSPVIGEGVAEIHTPGSPVIGDNLEVSIPRANTNGGATRSDWVKLLGQTWKDTYHTLDAPYAKIGVACKRLVESQGLEAVSQGWQRYLSATEVERASAARFAQVWVPEKLQAMLRAARLPQTKQVLVEDGNTGRLGLETVPLDDPRPAHQ